MSAGGRASGGPYDAIVVGGGHNGLVAAFELARAGMRVIVLERRELVGGACTTEEFAPGFRASPGAYVLSMLRPQLWRDMRLADRGVVVDPAGPARNVLPGGATLDLHGDPAATAEAIAPFSRRDAAAFPVFERRMDRLAQAILPLFDRPPPAVDRLGRAGGGSRVIRGLVGAGLLGARHRKRAAEIAYLFSTSMRRYLDEWFERDEVAAALGWEAISNTLAGPSTPGTAYVLLHDHASGVGTQGWGFVRGGMGVVTQAMADAAREAGVEIRTGAQVERILTSVGEVVGVALAGSGEEFSAPVVVSNADPKRTFLTLLDPDRDLPAEISARVRAYRCEGASMKINLAVAELPRLVGDTSSSPQPYHHGLLQLTKPLDDLDADQAGARAGEPASEPHLEVCFPTAHDPSLAPEGSHVVTVGARSQPYTLSEGTWDERRDELADRVVARLARAMPNLPGAILHREVLTPLDLERRLALTGGHHMHGDMAPDQLLFLRPVRGSGGYRTPVRGLYLCGAGTHPGGGVTGANGRNCAAEVLHDRREWRWVSPSLVGRVRERATVRRPNLRAIQEPM
jgi:phytoene dehydrogenase-like protein